MPTHIRAQCYWQVGSTLPRDRFVINPCFRHQLDPLDDDPAWQDLADDLAEAIKAWEFSPTQNELTVKLYEIKDHVAGAPNRPKATKTLNAASAVEATSFREIACCLSFYGGSNSPRQRGRLYLPHFKVTTGDFAVRPVSTTRSKVGALATIFADLGGINVDWIVWSPTNNSATKVTNWFVDDEWDVVRSRSAKPTTRTAGTTSG
jgi:hypothetical protein